MSEYQYYEFAAIDQPLSPQQQAELRSRSTRATITATSFINTYQWGDLKGDPLDWMRRHFDAHVYSANWGTCRLMLRLPRAALETATLNDFTPLSRAGRSMTEAFTVTETPEHWILDWYINDDSGDYQRFEGVEDSASWLPRLLPLRDELLRGDTRPLYLGWLARVCSEKLASDDLEPALPAGLQTLTPAQAALVEFLLIDEDWLTAAAEASAALPATAERSTAIDAWLAKQTPEVMRATLRLLLEGRSQEAERGLRQRFTAWQRTHQTIARNPARRTVAEIEERHDAAAARRLERERKQRAAIEAKRQAERAQHLGRLAENPELAWAVIDKSLQRGSAAAYDEALIAVKELSEALAHKGREAEFRAGLERLMSSHGRRTTWVKRLAKSGLLRGWS